MEVYELPSHPIINPILSAIVVPIMKPLMIISVDISASKNSGAKVAGGIGTKALSPHINPTKTTPKMPRLCTKLRIVSFSLMLSAKKKAAIVMSANAAIAKTIFK